MKLSIKEAGVLCPPRTPAAHSPFEIWRDQAGAIYAYGQVLGEECWMHVPDLASFRFTTDGGEIAAAVEEGVDEETVVDAYRRRVLPMAFHVSGREILHASSVTSAGGVTALCGAAFAGKSTLAFGLSQRGYCLWGDDVLAFEISNGSALAVSLPFEIRLRAPSVDYFGPEADGASSNGTAAQPPGSTISRLASICLLARDEALTTPVVVERLSLARAFQQMLVHACWFTLRDSDAKRRLIGNYLDLAARTAVFQVSFRSGLENLPAILDAIEEVITQADAKV